MNDIKSNYTVWNVCLNLERKVMFVYAQGTSSKSNVCGRKQPKKK